jgi:hypothetical protein
MVSETIIIVYWELILKNAVKLDNVSGLAYGNTVLLIQMKEQR